ncbi:MAG: thiolase domain-containing protein [Acidobacteriota bacterium]|nr:thiolase domain-containing protein [Acidobacteriota bacterium]
MERVGIIGTGHTRFGVRDDASVQELAFEAWREAVAEAAIEPSVVEASWIAAVPEYHQQRSVAGVVQEYLGLNPRPTWLTEAACASGSAAIHSAWTALRAGLYDVVAVIGCQKMTELETAQILALMGRVGDVQWESVFGSTFPGYYALFAERHMQLYGTTREQLADVAIKNHHYGAMNPKAMFRKEVDRAKVLASPPVAEPLRVFDCCANADGAACVLLATESATHRLGRRAVWLVGVGAATAPMSVLRREELTSLPSARRAAGQAYAMAGVGPDAIDVAQVHDCFTIAEILAYEDLGFCEPGQGGRFVAERRSYRGGGVAVNVDGGLKAKGHPIGATGVSMACEIVRQLRGQCRERQVEGARVGLTHNVGGIGQYCFVNVYRGE